MIQWVKESANKQPRKAKLRVPRSLSSREGVGYGHIALIIRLEVQHIAFTAAFNGKMLVAVPA